MAAGETDPLVNPSAVELNIARIMVEFSLSEVRHRSLFLVHWGSKRKRSAGTSSPATPLSFSSGSDDDTKPKLSKKQSKKNKEKEKKEKLMKEFKLSSELVRTLELEVKKVQLYLESLKSRNLGLKARRELLFRHRKNPITVQPDGGVC